jgi:hypothetical protein
VPLFESPAAFLQLVTQVLSRDIRSLHKRITASSIAQPPTKASSIAQPLTKEQPAAKRRNDGSQQRADGEGGVMYKLLFSHSSLCFLLL